MVIINNIAKNGDNFNLMTKPVIMKYKLIKTAIW